MVSPNYAILQLHKARGTGVVPRLSCYQKGNPMNIIKCPCCKSFIPSKKNYGWVQDDNCSIFVCHECETSLAIDNRYPHLFPCRTCGDYLNPGQYCYNCDLSYEEQLLADDEERHELDQLLRDEQNFEVIEFGVINLAEGLLNQTTEESLKITGKVKETPQ